jgi:hypothetical protein
VLKEEKISLLESEIQKLLKKIESDNKIIKIEENKNLVLQKINEELLKKIKNDYNDFDLNSSNFKNLLNFNKNIKIERVYKYANKTWFLISENSKDFEDKKIFSWIESDKLDYDFDDLQNNTKK